MTGPDILRRIASHKLEEIRILRSRRSQPCRSARLREAPRLRPFATSLEIESAPGTGAIIAEIKRASPSAGTFREHFDPPALARALSENGARALSVLTDRTFFRGGFDALTAARSACSLPVLAKDFFLDPVQIEEARIAGADAVLLILAMIGDDRARLLRDHAHRLGMDVIVEVHNEEELERANAMIAKIIGINNRDLKRFSTDIGVTLALAPGAHSGAMVISESGIGCRTSIDKLMSAGVHGFLIGEGLMRHHDVGKALADLLRTPDHGSDHGEI